MSHEFFTKTNCLILQALIDGFLATSRFASSIFREINLNSCTGICIRQSQPPHPTPPPPRTLTPPSPSHPHASSDHHSYSHSRTLLFGNDYQGEKNFPTNFGRSVPDAFLEVNRRGESGLSKTIRATTATLQ